MDAWGKATLSVNDIALEGYDVSAAVMAGGDIDLAIRGTIDETRLASSTACNHA